MSGALQSLDRQATTGSLTVDSLLSKISLLNKCTNRIQKIVKGLKRQVRQGDRDPLDSFKLSEVIEEVSMILGFKLKENHVSLTAEIANDLLIYGRSIQLGQILLNLINNSIEAIESNSEKWIKVSAIKKGTITEIRVMDSGTGIPKEIIEKIMQPFFTTKGVDVGTGMGLSICDKIAKEHGGSLVVDQTCANTCFVLCLPNENVSAEHLAS